MSGSTLTRPIDALAQLAADVNLTSVARGDLLFRGASKWNNLAAGAAGQSLVSGGAGADPVWGDRLPLTGGSLTGALTVDGSADAIQTVIEGHSSQTQPLLRARTAGAAATLLDLTNAGQLQLPVTGSGAGVLVGGDCLLYRAAADRWQTPDSVVVDGLVGIGGVPTAALHLQRAMTAAAWGSNGIVFRAQSATHTDNTSSGTAASQVANSFGQPTFAASNPTTYTNVATAIILGEPLAGANATFTNAWALWVLNGRSLFQNRVLVTLGTGVPLGTPALNAATVACFQNNATTGSEAYVSIIAGNAATSRLFFGDTDNELIGRLQYSHVNNSLAIWTNGVAQWTIDSSGNLTPTDGRNVILGTGTGMKLATDAGQKLGFWNATPIVQPSGAAQAAVTVVNTNGAIGGLTISAGYSQAEVTALRDACEVLADDVRNLSVLLHALRTAAVNSGLIKGAA